MIAVVGLADLMQHMQARRARSSRGREHAALPGRGTAYDELARTEE